MRMMSGKRKKTEKKREKKKERRRKKEESICSLSSWTNIHPKVFIIVQFWKQEEKKSSSHNFILFLLLSPSSFFFLSHEYVCQKRKKQRKKKERNWEWPQEGIVPHRLLQLFQSREQFFHFFSFSFSFCLISFCFFPLLWFLSVTHNRCQQEVRKKIITLSISSSLFLLSFSREEKEGQQKKSDCFFCCFICLNNLQTRTFVHFSFSLLFSLSLFLSVLFSLSLCLGKIMTRGWFGNRKKGKERNQVQKRQLNGWYNELFFEGKVFYVEKFLLFSSLSSIFWGEKVTKKKKTKNMKERERERKGRVI